MNRLSVDEQQWVEQFCQDERFRQQMINQLDNAGGFYGGWSDVFNHFVQTYQQRIAQLAQGKTSLSCSALSYLISRW
jgi:hypothetical protein